MPYIPELNASAGVAYWLGYLHLGGITTWLGTYIYLRSWCQKSSRNGYGYLYSIDTYTPKNNYYYGSLWSEFWSRCQTAIFFPEYNNVYILAVACIGSRDMLSRYAYIRSYMHHTPKILFDIQAVYYADWSHSNLTLFFLSLIPLALNIQPLSLLAV